MENRYIVAHLLAIQILLLILFYTFPGIKGIGLVIAMYVTCVFIHTIHK